MELNAKKMREHFQETGLKQSVIANKVGLSESAMSQVLSGNRKLEVGEYAKICNALDLPLDYFIEDKEV